MERTEIKKFLAVVQRFIAGESPDALIAAMPDDVDETNHDAGFYTDDRWFLVTLLLDDWRFDYYERFALESPELADMLHDWGDLLNEAEDHMNDGDKAAFLQALQGQYEQAAELVG